MRAAPLLALAGAATILFAPALVAASADAGQPGGAAQVGRATLENGLRVVVVRNAMAPVVSTQINYLVGGDEAPAGFPGMAHAQEHMMFRGSPGLSAEQLAAITAAMGGEFNADTQPTVTQYYLTVPADDLDIVLNLEAARMRGVLDSEELWQRERGAIEQEVAQDFSDPEYILYTQLLAHLFAGTPYAISPLGTRASFQRTTGAMLHDFHSRWYAPNNAILVIAGDVDPAAAIARVKDIFGPIAAHPLPARPAVKLGRLAPAALKLESDLPFGLAVVAYRLPGYASPDWAAGQVLAQVLNSKLGALYGLVVEGKALDAEFESEILPQAGMGMATVAYPSGTGGARLIEAVKNITAAYGRGGIPPEFVETAKRLERTDAEMRRASIAGLARDWSDALAIAGLDSPDDKLAAIERVSVADVNRVARAYLLNAAAVTAVLTPRPSGKPASRRPFHGGESFAPSQVETVALPNWAQRLQATPTPPRWTLNPTDRRLTNGLRIIVQPEAIVDAVAIYGEVKNDPDVQTPAGQEGVADLLAQLLPYGTTSLDRAEYQRALDEIGAQATLGTSFSLQVSPARLDRGVALLADGLLRPRLPKAAFAISQRQLQNTLPGLRRSPGYLAERARARALFPKTDPRLREPTPASVGALSVEDVRAYHRLAFRPDLTTIVVLGQVDAEQAMALISKHFGPWQGIGPTPPTDPPPVPPNLPSAFVVPDTSRVQDQVTLTQTLGITRLDPAFYTLNLGNNVLAGGFYATRLFRDLREETGLVYTVDATIAAGPTRSIFSIEYACAPANVSKARALVVRDLVQMQKEPVSSAELDRTRALLIRRIPLAESSFHDIAQGFIARALDGLPLDEPIRAAQRYSQITSTEVRAAFATFVRPPDLVQVTVGPPPR